MKRAENPRRFRVLAGLVLLMTAAAVGNVDPRKGGGSPRTLLAGIATRSSRKCSTGRQAIPETIYPKGGANTDSVAYGTINQWS